MLTSGTLWFGLVFSSAIVAVLLGLGQLLIRRSNRGNRMLFLIYLGLALVQFHGALFYFEELRQLYPRTAVSGWMIRLGLGPVIWMFFREVLLERKEHRRLWLHLILPLAGLACVLPILALEIGVLFAAPAWPDVAAYTDFARWAGIGTNAMLLGYLAPLVVLVARGRVDRESGRAVLKILAVVLLFGLGALVLQSLQYWQLGSRPAGAATLGLSAIIFGMFLLGYAYPEVLHVMRLEAFEQQRSRSPLKKVDHEELMRQLGELIENESIHHDEDLQLSDAARALKIRPKQLTYLLNHVHGVGFVAFINEYRIRDACALLLDEPDRSVTSIGYAVGFNSRSAFYRAFQARTGLTPNAYRKDRKPA